ALPNARCTAIYRRFPRLLNTTAKGAISCCPRISPAAAYTTLKRTTKVHRARLFSVISITYFLPPGVSLNHSPSLLTAHASLSTTHPFTVLYTREDLARSLQH